MWMASAFIIQATTSYQTTTAPQTTGMAFTSSTIQATTSYQTTTTPRTTWMTSTSLNQATTN